MYMSKRLELIKDEFKHVLKFKYGTQDGRYCIFSYDDLFWLIRKAEVLECLMANEEDVAAMMRADQPPRRV